MENRVKPHLDWFNYKLKIKKSDDDIYLEDIMFLGHIQSMSDGQSDSTIQLIKPYSNIVDWLLSIHQNNKLKFFLG